MAKNNNKGFGIAEIVIAITILTLLLTPVLRQLTNTMATNRKAKEQQYAVENAEYVLQYVQTSSLDELGNTEDTSGDVYCVDKTISDGLEGNEAKHICSIYVKEGSSVNAVAEQTIEYSTFEYELNEAKLGSRNTAYSRTVVLDDIANRIKTLELQTTEDSDADGNLDVYTYSISYNNEAAAEGFTLTTEGSMVQYDENGYVVAIVCEKSRGQSSVDPNQLNMGNMHNFDYTQMALINGYTTDYDEQAANDFYAEAMDILKNSDEPTDVDRWQQAISGGAQLDTSVYLDGMKKLTTLSITDNEAEKYYEVKVTVVYENTIGSTFVQKSYDNVYGQKFYYEDEDNKVPPEVYFEYQPISTGYVDRADEYSITYVYDDYILIDNQVKDAKIYLVKPKWDQARIFAYEVNDLDAIAADDTADAEDVYYYITDGTPGVGAAELPRTNDRKVNINIASANAVEEDNHFTIYTNLILEDSVTSEEGTSDNPQFTLNSSSVYSGATPIFLDNGTARTANNVPLDCLESMANEESKGNRLYTATVILEPVDANANTVILTGAKGAN